MGISKKAWTGTAVEATPGTIVQPPTKYIPTKAVFKGGKKRVYLNEERGDRNANYGVVDSVRQSSIEMKGPYYPDVSPVALWGWMGLPTTTNPTSGVYLHTFTLSNIPPSYSVSRSLDTKTYTIPYGVVEKASLHYSVDGKLLEFDSNWLGMFAQIYASPPTPTYSTVLPMAGYAPTLKFVDNVFTSDVSDLQIDFAQKLTLWYGANNSQDFVTVYFGERSITVDITARFDSDTLYQRWRNNAIDLLNFDIKGLPLVKTYSISVGGATGGTFTLSYGGYTTGAIAYNATAATITTALQGLLPVGTNGTVTGASSPWTATFTSTAVTDGLVLTMNTTSLTGATNPGATDTGYYNELNIQLPQLSWDTMEHDTSKDNVMIKAKGTAIVPAGASLITGFVQNNVTTFTT